MCEEFPPFHDTDDEIDPSLEAERLGGEYLEVKFLVSRQSVREFRGETALLYTG